MERKKQLEAIHKLRGLHKRTQRDKPLAEEWAEHKTEENRTEEAKWSRYQEIARRET